jgi:hypothetical protein
MIYGWIDEKRASRWTAPSWIIGLLVQLRAPCAADLIDEDVASQVSDGKRLSAALK